MKRTSSVFSIVVVCLTAALFYPALKSVAASGEPRVRLDAAEKKGTVSGGLSVGRGLGGFGGGFGGSSFGDGLVAQQKDSIWTGKIGITWSEDRDVLYGFSVTTGTWSVLPIEAVDSIVPVVGSSLGVVSLGRRFAAYSGTAGRWDVLELDAEPDAVPQVHQHHIVLRTKDHLYTFAEGLGRWTSPTDANLQDGIAGDRDPAEAAGTMAPPLTPEFLSIDPDGEPQAGEEDWEAVWQAAEVESLEISKLAGNLARTSRHAERSIVRDRLRDVVRRAFHARGRGQRSRMLQMEQKLAAIRKSLEVRETLKERIIERRVEELLDPDVDWNSRRGDDGLRVGSKLNPEVLSSSEVIDGDPDPDTSDPVDPASGKNGQSPEDEVQRPAAEAGAEESRALAAAVSVSENPRPFDWDKVDQLRESLRSAERSVIHAGQRVKDLKKEIEEFRVPWSEVSEADRRQIAKSLFRLDPTRAGAGGGRASTAEEDGDENTLPLEQNEQKFEQLRTAQLMRLCVELYEPLWVLATKLPLLERLRERYEGELEDQTLNLKASQMAYDAALQVHHIRETQFGMGVADRLSLLEAEAALNRAQIALERRSIWFARVRKIGKESPEVDPELHQRLLDDGRQLRQEVRSEAKEKMRQLEEAEPASAEEARAGSSEASSETVH